MASSDVHHGEVSSANHGVTFDTLLLDVYHMIVTKFLSVTSQFALALTSRRHFQYINKLIRCTTEILQFDCAMGALGSLTYFDWAVTWVLSEWPRTRPWNVFRGAIHEFQRDFFVRLYSKGENPHQFHFGRAAFHHMLFTVDGKFEDPFVTIVIHARTTAALDFFVAEGYPFHTRASLIAKCVASSERYSLITSHPAIRSLLIGPESRLPFNHSLASLAFKYGHVKLLQLLPPGRG